MSLRIYPNVTDVHGYVVRSIFLDDNGDVFPISRKLKRIDGLVSSQRVNTGKKYYHISYDPVADEITGRLCAGRTRHTLTPDKLRELLDRCGLGLLVWLSDNSLTPRDIGYYIDPVVLKTKQLIERHMLPRVFPNMSDRFIRDIASKMQTDDPVISEWVKLEALPFPEGNDSLDGILSSEVRRISNNPRVTPKKIHSSTTGIPPVLPIMYFNNSPAVENYVKSSIYLTLDTGEEQTINLDEYIDKLRPPVGWFISVLYTLPQNVREAVHVVHRPFITGTSQRNRGTVITVYTA